jgi:hypothetical protein
MARKDLPLFPTYADPSKWRMVRPVAQTKEEWQVIRLRVLAREDYTCQYCGHRAEKYQIVHHLDEDPANNSEGNLAVICQMCNVVMHAGQGCVIQGVVDLYKNSKYDQKDIVRVTRRMRFVEGKSDSEIIASLGLRREMPFEEDKGYLKKLFGFVTSRAGEPDDMYENWRRWEVSRSRRGD